MLAATLTIASAALLIEAAIGYPDRLFRAIGHPVTWIGALIDRLDRAWNRPARQRSFRIALGGLLVVLLLSVTIGAGLALHFITARLGWPGLLLLAVIASSLLAQRSLYRHVAAVAFALETNGDDLNPARAELSKIVGRDTRALDASQIVGAAIESLAENFSDGIVAPALWLGVADLPGGLAYKAINTADSMIGHRSERHEAFGKAAARLDDLVNLPASRLAALLIAGAAIMVPSLSVGSAVRAVRRDAASHRSPNAGWPEAAMAGALGVAVGGPRIYGDTMVDGASMNAGGRKTLDVDDLRRALLVYLIADGLLIAALGALALAATALF